MGLLAIISINAVEWKCGASRIVFSDTDEGSFVLQQRVNEGSHHCAYATSKKLSVEDTLWCAGKRSL